MASSSNFPDVFENLSISSAEESGNSTKSFKEMNFIEISPIEVVEFIFSHLRSEIVAPTLISPTANRIISNSLQLLQNCSFRISKENLWPGSRKYCRFDYNHLNKQETFENVPSYLTQLVFEECNLDAGAIRKLLARISGTLELLIFNRCRLHDWFGESRKDEEVVDAKPQFQQLALPKLKTLIISDLFNNKFSLLSMIKATNLIELGVIVIYVLDEEDTEATDEVFLDLVQCNPKLKMLHVPLFTTKKILARALATPKFELHLEELGVNFEIGVDDFDDAAMNFIESQKNSLKSLRLNGCRIRGIFPERLLSLKLARLELRFCHIHLLSRLNVQNSTIKSFACIANDMPNETIKSFIRCCTNLSACVASFQPEPANVLDENWTLIDSDEKFPKRIPWAVLRSLRFVGVFSLLEWIHDWDDPRRNYSYIDPSKPVSIEAHPYLILKFGDKLNTRKYTTTPNIDS